MEHYFSKKPSSSFSTQTISYLLNHLKFTFETAPSVFSKDKVDKGTDLLIRESQVPDTGTLLDIGSGYGVVGIVMKKTHPNLTVTCSDINERALFLTKKNSKINAADVKVIRSDLFSNIKEKFTTILTNPPQKAGKKICFKLIEESTNYLKPKGTLQLVARHQKGGKDLMKKMEDVFGNVKTLGRKSGYHLCLFIHFKDSLIRRSGVFSA